MNYDLTTFIIPSIDRPTLTRAFESIQLYGYIVEIDKQRVGPAIMRNNMIKQVTTPWVSFLDDDDTVTPDYVNRLKSESQAHPEADCIIFREVFLHGVILPAWPIVEMGNIPISFSVKTNIARQFPFQTEPHEDFEFVKRLEQAGKNIYFSPYVTYRMRH